MKRKPVIILIVVVLIVAGALLIIRKKREIAHLKPPQALPPAVMTAPVRTGDLEVTAHYLATIVPYTRSDLAARISGNILTITKHEGDPVRKGELLITIDDRELQDRTLAATAELLATREKLAGARSAYQTQRAVFERDHLLFQAGAISQEALDRSRAALDGAKATVDAYQENLKGLARNIEVAKTQAGYSRIYAPFAGVVSKRWNEPGDLAVPGKPILTLDAGGQFKVLAQVPQEELGPLHSGTKAYLSTDSQRLAVRVNRIYPALGKSMLATVEIICPSAPFHLPADATVGVDLVTREVSGLLVPEQAVVKSPHGVVLYEVVHNTVHLQPVTLLGVGSGIAAVNGPLTPGQQVAVAQENKLLTLTEGSRVTPAPLAPPNAPQTPGGGR